MLNDAASHWDIRQLLPHSGRMSLLTELVSSEAEGLSAAVLISEQDLFFDAALGGVGAWVGIEYMAQTVAAWAGLQSRLSGAPPKIGLLLGTRKYQSRRGSFQAGERLEVTARREFQADNGLGQFSCEIVIAGISVASATLTVFEPADPAEFLTAQGASA